MADLLPPALPQRLRRLGFLNSVVIGLWAIALAGIFVRLTLAPHQHNIFPTYLQAGRHWAEGSGLYTTDRGRGFVYSPLAAEFFAVLSLLPEAPANIFWRLLNAAALLGAVWWWLQLGLQPIPKKRWGLVFLLLLPLSLGNLSNGQANPLVIGLLLFGILGARTERWYLAALCVALATYLKIYPLAVGLLLALVFPLKFAWRLAAALALLGVLPFCLQRPSYVLGQYGSWIATRASDDRHLYETRIAPHDLWLVLSTLHIPIGEYAYEGVQLFAAAAVALVCLAGRLRRWPMDRLLVTLFTLGCCWMVLLGPATESPTYALMAPAVVLASVQETEPKWLRAPAVFALALLLAGFGINSFISHKDLFAIVQPVATIIFSCYAVILALTPPFWARDDSVRAGRRPEQEAGLRTEIS